MNLDDLERRLVDMDKRLEEKTLAMEMLQELKKQGQRKFIIIIILIVALVATNVGWLIYESQWETVVEEETTTQTIDGIDNPANSNFSQVIN